MRTLTFIQIFALVVQFGFLISTVLVTRKDLKQHKKFLLKKYKELPEGYLEWLLHRKDVSVKEKNNIRKILKDIEQEQ